jgi:DNA ligase (NAD+)
VQQLVAQGHVTRLSDVFRLDAETLAGLERMGEKSAANRIAALERARRTTFARFLYALGIRHVGEGVAELLADHAGGDLDALMRAEQEQLEAIEGVGPTIAESVVRFFADPRNRKEVADLLALGVSWPRRAPRRRGEGPLAGKTFVLTGTLRSRARRRSGASKTRAARWSPRCRRRRVTWWRAPSPAASSRRRPSWASRYSTKRA